MAVPKSADGPHRNSRIRHKMQIVNVFYQGKTRTDREPRDRAIHQEADAVSAKQVNHDQPLKRLFYDWRDKMSVVQEIQLQRCDQQTVGKISRKRSQRTTQDHPDHEAEFHQFEAVHVAQYKQEDQNRQQTEGGFE